MDDCGTKSWSPVEAITMLIGIPMPVARLTIEVTSIAVFAVMTEVSLIDVALALRLNRFVNESFFDFRHVNFLSSSIFFSLDAWLSSSGGAVAGICGYIFSS